MAAFFPLVVTLAATLIVALPALFAIRVVQPKWWASKRARTAFKVLLALPLFGMAIWAGGWSYLGAGISYGTILTLLPASFLLPVVAGADRLLARGDKPGPRRHLVSRRALLGVPALAAVGSATGFPQGHAPPRVREIPLQFKGLHPDLEGLRILQISDVHLGSGRTLDELQAGLDDAMSAKPDLIMLTGDLSDNPDLIPAALEMVAKANARYGKYACLGNHEYHYRQSRGHYEASQVPLFVGNGRTIDIGRAKLFIGGADDPRHMRGAQMTEILGATIASAASHAPSDADFRLLLCHRPDGHTSAAAHGFDLTLSGHTHGAQVGFLGRSILEYFDKTVGWWGAYAKRMASGRISRLYTTSGFGHWFAFRLGCPTEIPVLVLRANPNTSAEADQV